MTSSAQSSRSETERQFIEGLRARYADNGFDFVVGPAPDQLPDFFGSYQPDAIARKAEANVAIEVKTRSDGVADRSIADIRRLFDGHPDWQFVVSYMGEDPLASVTISAFSSEAIQGRLQEVRALLANQHRRAAFIMGWALLEAALHSVEGLSKSRALTAATVVQTLAMLGRVEPALETRMRSLVGLRNRIVHGDLEADPSPEQVGVVLSAVEQALELGSN